jgi:probable rRNA maturation factor
MRSAKPKLSLVVQYAFRARNIPTRTQLRRWIFSALEHDAVITLRIVGDEEGLELNRAYRKKNYATNVLTFVYAETKHEPLVGDIVLCASVVANEARQQRKKVHDHYAHLVTHGALHLQGYDHENERDAATMEQREIALLKRKGIANPYLV